MRPNRRSTVVEIGRPADYGQAIIRRRYELATAFTRFDAKDILDFGCGNGAQTAAFIKPDRHISAVDVEPSRLAEFQRYIDANNLVGVHIEHYDGQRLPFEDNRFDLVMSYDVLEHVDNEEAALQEILRVLKPGGELIISVPNKWWIFETHGAYLPYLPWNRVPFFSWLPGPLHRRWAKARIYTRRRISRLLTSQGLEISKAKYVTAALDVLGDGPLKRLLQWLIFRGNATYLPFLATGIMLHAHSPK